MHSPDPDRSVVPSLWPASAIFPRAFRSVRLFFLTRIAFSIAIALFTSIQTTAAPQPTENHRPPAASPEAIPAYVSALGLKQVQVDGLRVFYAPALQQHLDAIKEQFAKFSKSLREGRQQHEKLQGQSAAIVREINSLAGWSPNADATRRQ